MINRKEIYTAIDVLSGNIDRGMYHLPEQVDALENAYIASGYQASEAQALVAHFRADCVPTNNGASK